MNTRKEKGMEGIKCERCEKVLGVGRKVRLVVDPDGRWAFCENCGDEMAPDAGSFVVRRATVVKDGKVTEDLIIVLSEIN
jgi:RNase P subunit RPR2